MHFDPLDRGNNPRAADATSRRDLLKLAALAAIGATSSTALAQDSGVAGSRPAGPKRPRRVLRLAHLTDTHVQPERAGDQGLAACLRHVREQADPPQLILTGGDTIMDSFAADEARTKLQWEIWQKVLRDENRIPVESCIGNHDVWGWNKKDSRTEGTEARWGKKWALEQLRLERPWRSFDRAGWHFIVLDSIFPDGDGYLGKLDAEQMEWLKSDLTKTPKTTPVLVLTHIPILTATVFRTLDGEKHNEHRVAGSIMHVDSFAIRQLFRTHGNVRLSLSGHMHLVDRVDMTGTTYLCNGAVSGAWWRGDNYECAPGYALVDLYDDGTHEATYVTYGWKARP